MGYLFQFSFKIQKIHRRCKNDIKRICFFLEKKIFCRSDLFFSLFIEDSSPSFRLPLCSADMPNQCRFFNKRERDRETVVFILVSLFKAWASEKGRKHFSSSRSFFLSEEKFFFPGRIQLQKNLRSFFRCFELIGCFRVLIQKGENTHAHKLKRAWEYFDCVCERFQ